MAQFWLTTFATAQDGPADASRSDQSSAASSKEGLAISIIADGERFAILFCQVDDIRNPTRLACQIGFVNDMRSSAIGLDLGLQLVDARIEHMNGVLTVTCPSFGDATKMDYRTNIATITGMMVGQPAPSEDNEKYEPRDLQFRQSVRTADVAQPGTWLMEHTVDWSAPRVLAFVLDPQPVNVSLKSTRFPTLNPFALGYAQPAGSWRGSLNLWKVPAKPAVLTTRRIKRAGTFGVPAFRFENVEVLGFRIDLGPEGREGLAKLCRRLNFHLNGSPDASVSDFRYQPASRTLMLEMLRYGKMKVIHQSGTLQPDDFQSQHELLVRILVGKVDDDTGQARDPAVFVPAIFVDNTWSKAVGRTLQGFDKYMADFCVQADGARTPLHPDGTFGHEMEPRPLSTITEIRQATRAGADSAGSTVLELLADPSGYPDWDNFIKIDLGAAYSPITGGSSRWRQSDFDAPEFRRSFAREAVSAALQGFRSVQVSPIGPNRLRRLVGEQSAWICGEFKVAPGAQIAWPDGVFRLKLSAPAGAPAGWKQLAALLGAEDNAPVRLSLPRGSWYRMRFSTDLLIDDNF